MNIPCKLCLLFFLCITIVSAQTGQLQIDVWDEQRNPVENFTIINLKDSVLYTNIEAGKILIKDLTVGIYSFEVSAPGYISSYIYEKEVKLNQTQNIEIELIKQEVPSPADTAVSVLRVSAKFPKSIESPLSLRSLVAEEISRNPGANRDISKAIQSLPGVTSTSSFRNDLLIRGGGPNENRFFIDKVETPIINHFATQGASGGPRGIINVDFINEVDFYSSAFPANRGNAMSSIFDFKYRRASKEPFHMRLLVGLDDMIAMADGSSKNEKWEYLASIRRSNLQLLFSLLDLPILPTYYDMQGKISRKLKNGDRVYFLGIGAIDRFELNFDVERTNENLSILDAAPQEAPQNSYTLGLVYEKKAKNGNWNFIFSRDWLKNKSLKYYSNNISPENLLYNYYSTESNNRIRVEKYWKWGSFDFYTGTGIEQAYYKNNSFTKIVTQSGIYEDQYDTSINFGKYFIFANAETKLFKNQLRVSLGMRTDFSSYSNKVSNPIDQISPRLAASYTLYKNWYVNFASGIYYQLPPYTAMGYKENDVLVNKSNLRYTQVSHIALGIEYKSSRSSRITLEAYYKNYNHYPFSIRNGVNLANLGSDFGVVGIEPILSTGKGRTYGIEFLAQQRISTKIYGVLSYTLGWSEFTNSIGDYLPSSWDARHILSLTAGRNFKKNWNIGIRFRLQSPLPQTPYDLEKSALVSIWNVNNFPVLNYNLLNTQRGALAHQLDIRVEKKWYFKKWTLGLYADVVNIYGGPTADERDFYLLARDTSGNAIIENPQASPEEQKYILEKYEPEKNTPLPFIGIFVEF